MIVIITGSEALWDYADVCKAIAQSGFNVREVVTPGKGWGIDGMAEVWAFAHGIPVTRFLADAETYGPIRSKKMRNRNMINRSDAVIAVTTKNDKETLSIVGEAKKKGLKSFVVFAKPRGE